MKKDEHSEKETWTLVSILFFLITPFLYIAGLLLWLFDILPSYSMVKGDSTAQVFWRVGDVQEHLTVFINPTKPKENQFTMITVKATQPNSSFSINIASAADSEGNPIPASDFSLSEPQSDNPSAVEIISWNAETRRGELHFGVTQPDGSPNIANLTVNILNADGSVAAPLGEQVAIVHGDVATFEGSFAFELDTPTVPATEAPTSNSGDTGVPMAEPETPAEELPMAETEVELPMTETEEPLTEPEDLGG